MRALVTIVLTVLALVLVPLNTANAADAAGDGCDPIDPTGCLLPFPNDWFTVAEHRTATGRRVSLAPAAMPRNAAGVPMDPAEWNRGDGFSPGSMVLTHVPNIDLARTGAAPITDVGRSLRRDAPIVLLDTATGERWPYWAELDANATRPERQALIVRPARNLREGHRYAVALRSLRDGAGQIIEPPAAFAKIIGPALPEDDPLFERQRQGRRALADLRRHGVRADDLYLAWDFTVASRQGLAGRMLHIRDEALRGLGGGSPRFTITQVTDKTPEQDDRIAREVTGFVTVPGYLNLPGGPPGSAFNLGRDGLPEQLPGNTQAAPFQCEIPRRAFTDPVRPSLYGHGLLGRESEVAAGNVKSMAAEHGFMFCASRWIGMAQEDVPNVVSVLSEAGRFSTIADRAQQGMLGFIFLGRAMTRGFSSHPAFRTPDGRPLIDGKARLVYDGNSQGGIMGGALVAVSPDLRRGVLGVPGMNYSTLLNRSVDFLPFANVFNPSYPDKLDQQVIFALMQMLWDRAEADGYAQHLTGRPLPGTPPHQVLMHVAFGDHQVSTVTAEVEARTAGVRIHTPAIAPGRNPDVVPYWGIRPIPSGPFRGSGMIIWDSGSPAPPLTNTPPVGEQFGRDPHSDPRNSPVARRQKAIFLTTGRIVDVCAAAPCTAPPTG